MRVISFFHSVEVPLFALTAFSKRERGSFAGRPERISNDDETVGRDISPSKRIIMTTAADSIRKGLDQAVRYAKGDRQHDSFFHSDGGPTVRPDGVFQEGARIFRRQTGTHFERRRKALRIA